jgi:CheY-like chemotaxis protein
MIVTCPRCQANLTIPDDRLPKGKMVTAACPRCKGPITIDSTGAAAAPVSAAAVETAPPAEAPGPTEVPPATVPEEPVSYGERGQPRALVCMTAPAERQQVLATIKGAGYATQIAANPAEALERLRFTVYAVVVVREGFDGPAEGGHSLWEALAEMPMAMRRNTHVVFVSPTVASHDPAAAFAKSVDLVIHPNDLPHLADALKRSLTEAEQIYRVFRETQVALGKG